jgi:hypothetical protein
MDNLIYKDYAAWKLENIQILEQFQHNDNIIYERLEPVYAVLNYIYDMVCEGQELDEDLETIFEVGYQYLSNQFEVIKIYFETLFQSKCDDFQDYAQMLLYLIYINDIRSDLENNGIDSDLEVLNDTETTIENMIMERSKDYVYIGNLMNETLKQVFSKIDYEYVGIVDIFVEIAENLGIFLYEDKEFVIGKEI